MRVTATTEPVNLAHGRYLAITAVEIGQYSIKRGTPIKQSSNLYQPGDFIEISEGWHFLESCDEFLTQPVPTIERID